MKLYVCPGAPNPDKLRLYLAEKLEAGTHIPLEQVSLSLRKGAQRSPEHLQRNPFGKLPVLELDDGSCLTESLAIMEYLEELHPLPPMIGQTALERARTRELERICDLRVLVPVAQIVHATRSPLGKIPDPAAAERYGKVLATTLEILDQRLSDGRLFLTGCSPSIADCSLAAALAFARAFELELIDRHDHIGRWDAYYRSRPAARSTLRH